MIVQLIIEASTVGVASVAAYASAKLSHKRGYDKGINDGKILYGQTGVDELDTTSKIEVINWNRGETAGNNKAQICPKCLLLNLYKDKKIETLTYCQCLQYSRGHFHWQCNSCYFKAIIKSKDNKWQWLPNKN
jgi:hypothetical protein